MSTLTMKPPADCKPFGPAAALVAALFSTLALFAIPMPSRATE